VEGIEGERANLHSWFMTGAPVVFGGTGAKKGKTFVPGGPGAPTEDWLPIKDPGALADTRYEAKSPSPPEWWDGTFLRGWTATATSGTNELTQGENLHPDAWGVVAINANGPASAGTYVFDAAPDGGPGLKQRLQSIFSVEDLGSGMCGVAGKVISLQLGNSAIDGLSGHHVFVEHLSAGGKRAARAKGLRVDKIHCVGEAQGGGPFWSGGPGDVHAGGKGVDGNPIQPIHLGTWSLFKGQGGDGPLKFQPNRWMEPDGLPSGLWKRVHLRWNGSEAHRAGCVGGPGKWEWEIQIPFTIPERPPRWPPRKPPPRQPPPEERDPRQPPPEERPPRRPRRPRHPPGGEEIITGPPGGFAPGGVPGGLIEPPLPPGVSEFAPGGIPGGLIEPPLPPGSGRPVTGGNGGAEGGQLIPHTPYNIAAPCIQFKPLTSRPGEWDPLNDPEPSSEDMQLLIGAPLCGEVSGYATGDGSWHGFEETVIDGWPCGNGGMVVHPSMLPVRDILGGDYHPSTGTKTWPVKTHLVIPGGMSSIDFAQPSGSTTGGTTGGHRIQQGATGLQITGTDSGGELTTDEMILAGNTLGWSGFVKTAENATPASAPAAGCGTLYQDSADGHIYFWPSGAASPTDLMDTGDTFDPDTITVHKIDAAPPSSEAYEVVIDPATGNVVVDTLASAGSGGGSAVAGVITRTYTGGVTVGDSVYQKGDGSVDKADATGASTCEAFVGFVTVLDSPSAGQCQIQYDGDLTALSGLTPGETYILGTTAGGIVGITDTGNLAYPTAAGSVVREVGLASSSTSIFVQTQREMQGN